MPSAWAWCGSTILVGVPSMQTTPPSAACTPVTILTSVLLPAPFSPQIARISQASSASVTFLRTSFGPNRLVSPSTARTDIELVKPAGDACDLSTNEQITAKHALIRAARGEPSDVLLGDAVDRHNFVFLQLPAIEVGLDLLRRHLCLFRGDLGGRGILLSGIDVDDAILHAIAGDADNALVCDAELKARGFHRLDRAGRLIVRHGKYAIDAAAVSKTNKKPTGNLPVHCVVPLPVSPPPRLHAPIRAPPGICRASPVPPTTCPFIFPSPANPLTIFSPAIRPSS